MKPRSLRRAGIFPTGQGARIGSRVLGWTVLVVAQVVLLATTPASATLAAPTVSHEVPATVNDRHRATNSPALAVDPTDNRFVVLAIRLDAPSYGCELQVSGDGGRSWVGARPVAKLPPGVDRCYGPEVAFDRAGRLYLLFVGLQGAASTPVASFLVMSPDRGASFTAPRRVLGPDVFSVRMAIDPDIGRLGRIHVVWIQAQAPPGLGAFQPVANPILTAYSDDGGRSFSPPRRISNRGPQRAVAPALALGPGHRVYVAYYDLGDDAIDYQGLEGPVWEGPWSLVVATSSDGGRHFGGGVVADAGIVPPGRVMLIFTMPPPALAAGRNGRVFLAWPDARHGDPDILLRRSMDAGCSWGRVVRVNDDPPGDGRTQALPHLGVAAGGRVDAVFYDRRSDPADVRNDVGYTYSANAGATFAPTVRVDSRSSDSRIGISYAHAASRGLVEFGSRLGLASLANGAIVAWTDTRNAVLERQQEVFSARVHLPGASPRAAERRRSPTTGRQERGGPAANGTGDGAPPGSQRARPGQASDG